MQTEVRVEINVENNNCMTCNKRNVIDNEYAKCGLFNQVLIKKGDFAERLQVCTANEIVQKDFEN